MLQALVDAGARLDEEVDRMLVCNINKRHVIIYVNLNPETFIMKLIETTERNSTQQRELKNLLLGLWGGQAKEGGRNKIKNQCVCQRRLSKRCSLPVPRRGWIHSLPSCP